ncbi:MULTISPECIES: hypothetical protein [Arthrobacter]|uniref:OB-fold nucleic acid binding domain-containing protein n=1 Tax=Arthrobacter caoxuetaonis TaxID=2886935 RepID=A0A9X1SDU7_9MICC|nr:MULTISPECIES: hypothetical protein [Arthrobacter]MCC3283776.1 hypothetical protein [Arthrobacter caoxuetaonis]MCC3299082.1 hypothetical protein [Arthrobacter caoxuetaonis]MCC9193213.1 hypothetical protein [Arthrobacter sp. zg-Y916]USQ58583.1 hypothetical protein NF551_07135 [Arthrobacter caoxuetaonis]
MPAVAGASPRRTISDLPDRGRVHSSGYVESVTLAPADDAPRFTAVLDELKGAYRDPSASLARRRVRLIWVGQRRIPGIVAGTQVAFEGMVSPVNGIPTVFNPRYEIIGRPEGA